MRRLPHIVSIWVRYGTIVGAAGGLTRKLRAARPRCVYRAPYIPCEHPSRRLALVPGWMELGERGSRLVGIEALLFVMFCAYLRQSEKPRA